VTLTASGVLGDVLLRGRRISLDVESGVTDASFSVSTTQIGELALSIYDPDFAILASGLLSPGGKVDFRRHRQEITATETTDAPDGRGLVTIRCRAAAVGKLKRRRGPKVMEKASPSQFVIAECKKVGAKFVVQPSAKRRSVARDTGKSEDASRDEKPSSWTTFERLARELGYALFESENTIYFGKPSWLRKRDGVTAVVSWATGEPTDCIGVPKFRNELDPTEAGVSVSFDVPRSRLDEFSPGARVTMEFPVYGEQTYLVTGLSFPVAGIGNATVTAGLPVDPKPEPPRKNRTGGSGGGGGPRAGGGFVSLAPVGSRTLGALLRQAGFTGDALNVAAGIAIAESGANAHAIGDTGLTNAKWGPSVGVFQIRSLNNPGAYSGLDAMRDRGKLMGALYNATLAFKMSGGGRNWSAWSAYTNGSYRQFVGQVNRTVANWGGLPAPPRPPTRPGGPPNPTGATGRRSAYDFVNLCLRQAGDTYVYGGEASLTDPDPDVFDCSELIQWAAHRVGCFMPDGSSNQMAYMRSKGTAIAPSAGLAIRGAVLWIPGHVAVSLGGHTGTIEATNRTYGVRRWGPGRSFSWQGAGRIPGMRY
jgi:hypothetical protein